MTHASRIRELHRRTAALGLSMVNPIVQAHGGEVWVRSERGKGATFCFTLPR